MRRFDSKSIQASTLQSKLNVTTLGLLLLTLQQQAAHAQLEAYSVSVGSIDGLASVTVLEEGQLEVRFEDGRVFVIPEAYYRADADAFYITEAMLSALLYEDGSEEIVVGALPGLLAPGLASLGAGGLGLAAGSVDESGRPESPPNIISNPQALVPENQTTAYRPVSIDANGDALTYSLTGGADAALFEIDSLTGIVSFISAPDFEAPADNDGNNVYTIEVSVSDGVFTITQPVTITVTDVDDTPAPEPEPEPEPDPNSAPEFEGEAVVAVAENQTEAFDADATDPDGDTLTYTLSGGADASLFAIDETTGEVVFLTAPDFEAPSDADGDNVYEIEVTVSDGDLSNVRAVTISVTDVQEPVIVPNAAPIITSSPDVSVPENTEIAYTATAEDTDNDTLTYAISGGADLAAVAIDPISGVIRFNTLPDFEAPSDADGDNVYNIEISVTDGENTTRQNVEIGVTNVDETDPTPPPQPDSAPVFTSFPPTSVNENDNITYVPVAVDPDGDAVSYSLVPDLADNHLFRLDPNTGTISFRIAPDFETDGDNEYTFIVTATSTSSDGQSTLSTTQSATLRIINVDEGPSFTSTGPSSVRENSNIAYVPVAIDPEGDEVSYSLEPGIEDNNLFILDSNTGAIRFRRAPDFETGGDNRYTFVVTATSTSSDGHSTLSTTQSTTLRVTNVDEAPVFESGATASVDENSTDVFYVALATDPEGTAISYSLVDNNAGTFAMDEDGNVSFVEGPDFEDLPEEGYSFTVRATDATGRFRDQTVTVTVDDVDEAPVFESGATASVDENSTDAFYTAVATDPEGTTVTYSLVDGDSTFAMDEDGSVSFVDGPNFEDLPEEGYSFTVRATDATGQFRDQTVIVTVENVDEAPVFGSETGLTIDEGQNIAYQPIATDEDGDTVSYELVAGSLDTDLFALNRDTGEVAFITPPDFIPGGINQYQFTVRANSTGTSNTVQSSDLTVTIDVNVVQDRVEVGDLPSDDGFVLEGGSTLDLAGATVSSIGDFNGDGIEDILIGARGAGQGDEEDAGQAYIVFGGQGFDTLPENIVLSDLTADQGIILTGANPGDQLGGAVANAGDVNGDGFDDIILAARDADPTGENSGEIYVIYGGQDVGDGNTLDLSALTTDQGFTLTGIQANDGIGLQVSAAGDVNGDGYDDVLIGAENGEMGYGAIYVIYGSENADNPGDISFENITDVQGFTISGTHLNDRAGASVSAAGDVNNDGYDDIFVSAPNANNLQGAGYIVFGSAETTFDNERVFIELTDQEALVLTTSSRSSLAGMKLDTAGDVNGDGHDDFLITAETDNVEQVYLVFGGPALRAMPSVDLDTMTSDIGIVLTDATDTSLAHTISDAGDVNGDGFSDLLISPSVEDQPGTRSSDAYVLYGSADFGAYAPFDWLQIPARDGFVIAGPIETTSGPVYLSSAGDVNGDGFDDILVGAPDTAPNGAQSGTVYVIYGGREGSFDSTPIISNGTDSADNFTGNAGDDVFSRVGADDVVRGGAGDDRIEIISTDFADIDGGNGQDTLVLAGSEQVLDLSTGPTRTDLDSIEIINLGDGNNTLRLDTLSVLDLAGVSATTDGITTLTIDGASGGLILADLNDWIQEAGDDGYEYLINGDVQIRYTPNITLNQAPFFTDGDDTFEIDEGQNIRITPEAFDQDGDAITLSLIESLNYDLFTFDPETGRLTFIEPPQVLEPNSSDTYQVGIRATDAQGLFTDQIYTILVRNDDGPVFISPTTVTVEERSNISYIVEATDTNEDEVSYELISNPNDIFRLENGIVTFNTAPVYDPDGENIYQFTVRASSTGSTGEAQSAEQTVRVTVDNVEDAPEFESGATASVAENSTDAFYTALATDPDGTLISYSLVNNEDGTFAIDDDGNVRFVEGPDFEDLPEEGHSFTVRATDESGQFTDQTVTVTVDNVDEAPVFESGEMASVDENSTDTFYTAVAIDPEGTPVTYSLVDNDDLTFAMDDEGNVRFVEGPDFEDIPEDGYSFTVRATDENGQFTDQTVTVTVDNVDEVPVFESGVTASVVENSTDAFYTALATDPEGTAISYSLVNSDGTFAMVEDGAFAIDEDGHVSFVEGPDFEDLLAEGYSFTVRATDESGQFTDQTVTVTVDNVDEAPVFESGATASIDENSTDTFYTALAIDPEGTTVTYSLVNNEDGTFAIDDEGNVNFVSGPDFEDLPEEGYSFTVRATDEGGEFTDQTVTVTVDNVNELPVFESGVTASVAENSTEAFYTALATDPEGTPVTYSLIGGDGTFVMDENGNVSLSSPADFEDLPAEGYSFMVRATDATGYFIDQTVTVTVDNVDEAPVFESGETAFVEENSTDVFYTALATDPDRTAISYSLVNNDDGTFAIDDEGNVNFVSGPDFEDLPEEGYSFTVRATDESGQFTDQTVTVTVDNVDEAPVFESGEMASVDENSTDTFYTAVAIDPEGTPVTYSLVDNDDLTFAMDDEGNVRFVEGPDFEDIPEEGYSFTVRATDESGDSTDQLVTVSVDNVDEAPRFISIAPSQIRENQNIAYLPLAIDPEDDVVSYSLEAGVEDNDLFILDPNGGFISFRDDPDFETGGDNLYTFVVTATSTSSDGQSTLTSLQTVTIGVTDVNEAPFFDVTPTPIRLDYTELTDEVVYTFPDAIDPENDTLSYSIIGDVNGDLEIVGNDLVFIVPPDIDVTSIDLYLISIQAEDSAQNTAQLPIEITILPVNDPPFWESPEAVTVDENQTLAYIPVAIDRDFDRLVTYTITHDPLGIFEIREGENNVDEVYFTSPPNYEDIQSDPTFTFTIEADDGHGTSERTVTVTIADVNEAPEFDGVIGGLIVEEGTVPPIHYITNAIDPEDDPLTYSISGDRANEVEIVNGNQIRFIEPPTLGENEVEDSIPLTLTATDPSGLSTSLPFDITVIRDQTAEYLGPFEVTIDENTTDLGIFSFSEPVLVLDVNTVLDTNITAIVQDLVGFTYSASFVDSIDFEALESDQISSPVSIAFMDLDGNFYTADFTLNIQDVDEAPVFDSADEISVEGGTDGVVYTAIADDPEGDTVTFSLAMEDTEQFSIDTDSGAVTFNTGTPNYSPDGENTYTFTVIASSTDPDTGDTLTETHPVTLTITEPMDGQGASGGPADMNFASVQPVDLGDVTGPIGVNLTLVEPVTLKIGDESDPAREGAEPPLQPILWYENCQSDAKASDVSALEPISFDPLGTQLDGFFNSSEDFIS